MNWDAIKAAHPIAQIVGDAIKLEKAGNEWRGLCPFHDEKTPSFHVVPAKDKAFCHGCGWHGDVVDFVEDFQKCTKMEAVDMLTGGKDLEQSQEDKEKRAELLKSREAEQLQARNKAIKTAQDLWESATRADPHHPYLIRKGVEAHSLRQTSDGKLMLPIYDSDGEIQSIQTIDDNGGKLFLSGAPTAQGRMMIGVNMGRSIICEGYATGATIFDAVPDQVCISYSCVNMEKIAREKHAAGQSFILAADAGQSAEKMALLARELGVPVVIPHNDIPDNGTDFNDQARAFGIEGVAKMFRDAMKVFAEQKKVRDEPIVQDNGPVDLWSSPNVPELPRGLLPPIIEQYAFESAGQMGTDPAGFAMSALSCCAAMITDAIKVQPKQHEKWTENARIWTMLIGPPSTRKSPMMAKTAGAIKRMDAEQLGENNRNLADWQDAGGPKSGTPKPLAPRLRIEDATTEAVQEVAKESPNGILLLQDELSGFFGRIEKYGGKGGGADRSFWLQAYGGGQYAVNRVGRGAFLIDNLSVTMLGGIQPEPLISLVQGSTDDGLIQRFIPITLRKAERDRDVPVPPVADKFDSLLETLRNMQPRTNFFGAQPFMFSEGAKQVREDLADSHYKIVGAFEGVNNKLSTHIGKYDGLFVRMSLLWHCIEYAGGGEVREIPEEISEATARRVADFISGFIMGHSFAFYGGMVGLADNHELVQALGGYILAHEVETITIATAIRSVRQMRKASDQDQERAMNALEAFGWLEPSKTRTSKPSWTVPKQVHERFAETANEERERRAMVKEIIKHEVKLRVIEKEGKS